jgi:hypothetical protein
MTPGSRPDRETRGDPRLGRLLRWYPRAWRERYGEEFLAMVEDTLDGGRPGWRLRLGVARAGLRERGRRARRAGLAAGNAVTGLQPLMAPAFIVASFPQALKASPPAARAWQAAVALGILAAIVVFAGIAVLASGLTAGPALVRFLRAGGWPEIRRRVAWAAGASMIAAAVLAWLVTIAGSMTYAQMSQSWTYATGLIAATLAVMVAFGLWAAAAAATARRLDRDLRVRTAAKLLAAMAAIAVSTMLALYAIWLSALEASVPWLLFGATLLVMQCAVIAPYRWRRARRSVRRMRAAAARGR